jgi:hypothetical protein
MAAPVLITADAGPGYQGAPGPMLIGGNLYAVLNDSDTSFQVWQSTNNGVTWTRLDAAGEPVSSVSTGWAACTDGTSIYVAYPDASFVLEYAAFDTTTGLWGSPVNTTNTCIAVYQVAFRPFGTSLIICGKVSDASPGLAYCVATIGSSATGFSSCSNNTAGFYTTCWRIVAGAGNTFQFVYVQAPVSAGTQSLQIQSLNSSNVLGSVIQIDNGSAPGSLDIYGAASAYSDGTTIVLAWAADSGDELSVWTAPVSTMVFVLSTVTTTTSFSDFNVATSLGTGTILVVSLSTNTFVFYVSNGSGFGSPNTLVTGLDAGKDAILNILQPFVASGWAIVFEQNTGTYYLAGVAAAVVGGMSVLAPGASQPLPNVSAGALCRFARPIRCRKAPYRTILTSKVLVYGAKV